MRFAIANTISKGASEAGGKGRGGGKVGEAVAFEFQMNPTQSGFSFERINKSKDPNFWSLRVSDGIRIIAHRAPDMVTMCYVDRHDEAYQWAERRRFEVHPETGAAQIVEIRETVREITKVIEKQVNPPLFGGFEADYLFALGIPTEWLDAVRLVSEDNFDALIGHLPDEAVERLLDLAAGKPVPRPVPIKGVTDVTALLHPDAQRRFRVIDNQQELRQALDFPWDQWIVFGQLTELNLDDLVSAIPQSFANIAVPSARFRTSVEMAAHAVEINAQAFIGIIPRLIEEVRCGRAQRASQVDRPLRLVTVKSRPVQHGAQGQFGIINRDFLRRRCWQARRDVVREV
jgi:hypothetical protein